MAFLIDQQDAPIVTPELLKRRRAIADALAQKGISADPIQHWTQGAARLAEHFGRGILREAHKRGTHTAAFDIKHEHGLFACVLFSPKERGHGANYSAIILPSTKTSLGAGFTARPL